MKYIPERPSDEFLTKMVPPQYDPNSDYQTDNDYSFSRRLNKEKDDDDFDEEDEDENEKEEL